MVEDEEEEFGEDEMRVEALKEEEVEVEEERRKHSRSASSKRRKEGRVSSFPIRKRAAFLLIFSLFS